MTASVVVRDYGMFVCGGGGRPVGGGSEIYIRRS